MEARPQLLVRETGGAWLPPFTALAAVSMMVGLGLVFFYAPLEATMGVAQKIFYFHVPCAIAAYVAFIACCIASVAYLLTGSARADVVARASCEIGVLFCTAVLISGPLWARKAWGTWWTGEPRLLLTLVMCLIFVAYLVVRQVGGRSDITSKICALLAILGVADIPIIRMAVDRWRGNHPEVLREGGGGISPEMGHAFLAMVVATALVFTVLLVQRIRLGLLEEDIEAWHRALQPRRARIDDLRAQRD